MIKTIKLEKTCECTKVYKKSNCAAFHDLKVGDKMYFSVEMSSAGYGGNGTYAKFISCENLQNHIVSELSFNQIERVMCNYEWSEVKC